MKVLAWILFLVSCLGFFAHFSSSIVGEKAEAGTEFWKAMFKIPAIVFFCLYLF